MAVSREKINKLQESGYRYDFSRDIYINTRDRVIISKEALEDHDDNWLERQLADSKKNEWLFIFTDKDPTQEVKQEILAGLGL